MINNKAKVAVTLALLAAAAGTQAQTAAIRPSYQFPTETAQGGPATLQIADGPVFLMPYLGLAAGHDDNLFLSSVNEKSSTLYVFSPGFRLDARDPNKVVQVTYQGQIGRYAQSEADDYVDHALRSQFDIAITGSTFARLGFDYLRAHEPRGATDRPVSDRPDRYRQSNPYAMFVVGAPGAAGRVELFYNDAHRRYLNNRLTTTAADRDTREWGGAFYWRVMPRTYVLAEARHTEIEYQLAGSPFSSEERRLFGGVSWEATASTTGTVKVGSLRKKFDSPIPTFSGTSWEAIVTWAPRTYSRFDFYTSRSTTESTGLGSFILTEASGINWAHGWSSFLSTELNLRYQKDEYQEASRSDDTKMLGFRVGYKFRRWLTLGAEFTHTKRDSNQSIFQYDKNLYLLTATATM